MHSLKIYFIILALFYTNFQLFQSTIYITKFSYTLNYIIIKMHDTNKLKLNTLR